MVADFAEYDLALLRRVLQIVSDTAKPDYYSRYKLANGGTATIEGHRDMVGALKENHRPSTTRENGATIVKTQSNTPLGLQRSDYFRPLPKCPRHLRHRRALLPKGAAGSVDLLGGGNTAGSGSKANRGEDGAQFRCVAQPLVVNPQPEDKVAMAEDRGGIADDSEITECAAGDGGSRTPTTERKSGATPQPGQGKENVRRPSPGEHSRVQCE